MDSATGWILGICGTVVGGLIVLYFEYNYFQKSKHKIEPQQLSEEPQQPSQGGDSLWKVAIKKAVEDFGTTRPDKVVEIRTWTVSNDRAQVHVYLKRKPPIIPPPPGLSPRPSPLLPGDFYTLTVDRAGDILDIKNP